MSVDGFFDGLLDRLERNKALLDDVQHRNRVALEQPLPFARPYQVAWSSTGLDVEAGMEPKHSLGVASDTSQSDQHSQKKHGLQRRHVSYDSAATGGSEESAVRHVVEEHASHALSESHSNIIRRHTSLESLTEEAIRTQTGTQAQLEAHREARRRKRRASGDIRSGSGLLRSSSKVDIQGPSDVSPIRVEDAANGPSNDGLFTFGGGTPTASNAHGDGARANSRGSTPRGRNPTWTATNLLSPEAVGFEDNENVERRASLGANPEDAGFLEFREFDDNVVETGRVQSSQPRTSKRQAQEMDVFESNKPVELSVFRSDESESASWDAAETHPFDVEPRRGAASSRAALGPNGKEDMEQIRSRIDKFVSGLVQSLETDANA